MKQKRKEKDEKGKVEAECEEEEDEKDEEGREKGGIKRYQARLMNRCWMNHLKDKWMILGIQNKRKRGPRQERREG